MIKHTRLANDEERTTIIHYLSQAQREERIDEWPSNMDWASASFIVLEVQDLEGKIVVLNKVHNLAEDILDIITAHYLLHSDNSVTDISNLDLPELF